MVVDSQPPDQLLIQTSDSSHIWYATDPGGSIGHCVACAPAVCEALCAGWKTLDRAVLVSRPPRIPMELPNIQGGVSAALPTFGLGVVYHVSQSDEICFLG